MVKIWLTFKIPSIDNIALVTYSSIAQGILTGKYPLNISFKENDARHSMILFTKDV